MTADAIPESLPPLTPATFHILLALVGAEQHGYGIMQEVEANTDGNLILGPGTLYTAIKRLRREGLIEESDARPDPEHDDERRRYYRLTERGLRAARAESARLARAVALAEEKKLLRTSPALGGA